MKNSKQRAILVAILVIIICGLILRFYNIDRVYTEYDDIGVLATHKGIVSYTKTTSLSIGEYFDINIKINTGKINDSLLDSPFYPLYIAHSWTYPIGQYLTYPLLINESDTYYEKLIKGRSVSALISTFSLFLLTYLLYSLNNQKWSWYFLPPLIIMSFSINSILFAHHMSPYSLSVLCMIISLILFHRTLLEKLNITFFFIYLGALSIFSYLIILTLPIFVLLIIINRKLFTIRKIFKELSVGLISFVVIFTPLFILFFKPNRGMLGIQPPSLNDGFISFFSYLVKQFIVSGSTLIASFSTNSFLNTTIFILILITFLITLINKIYENRFNTLNSLDTIMIFILLFFIEWIILHSLRIITMEGTRHILVWAPLICITIYYLIQNIKSNKFINVMLICISVILTIFSFSTNINVIKSKNTNFLVEQIDKSNQKNTILTYGGTFAPLLYYQVKNQVYNIDSHSFNDNFENLNFSGNIYLVSQQYKFDDFKKTDGYKINNKLFSVYQVTTIKEIHSNTYFGYNNNQTSSNPNSFYLYLLKKK